MSFEKTFLREARQWLACRLYVMGGEVEEYGQQYDFESWLIGDNSEQRELEMICKEFK